jgi:hypothetical protein
MQTAVPLLWGAALVTISIVFPPVGLVLFGLMLWCHGKHKAA